MLELSSSEPERRNRWFFGGISSAGAACITHPLDLIKVHMQTNESKLTVREAIKNVLKNHGVLAFYNGISASIMRQLAYATTAFAIYDVGKSLINSETFISRVGLAFLGGTVSGFMGVPADVINVRMQHDVKLPIEERRNYKHVFDGIIRVCREEGVLRLFVGSPLATLRAIVLNVSSMPVYDQSKIFLRSKTNLNDGIVLHSASSFIAAICVTTMVQPIDVLKTRAMNAKSKDYKGYVPSLVRNLPHTILMYIFMEQLRLHFGIIKENPKE
ncbi:mitochondrial dicarboxylate carrier-like isoform X2 [Teleopsis dalmanni]|uniref:mitochondrial dicarboxylate carrier-like isoform X2 n=1 Tax=Teleopsis dalmanni TaxID=139649 RepID=UPI0018CE8FBA|nr:mitochondrial dicarboxylate carrier-like isoform X2 [Teleopsis dalmanni]